MKVYSVNLLGLNVSPQLAHGLYSENLRFHLDNYVSLQPTSGVSVLTASATVDLTYTKYLSSVKQMMKDTANADLVYVHLTCVTRGIWHAVENLAELHDGRIGIYAISNRFNVLPAKLVLEESIEIDITEYSNDKYIPMLTPLPEELFMQQIDAFGHVVLPYYGTVVLKFKGKEELYSNVLAEINNHWNIRCESLDKPTKQHSLKLV